MLYACVTQAQFQDPVPLNGVELINQFRMTDLDADGHLDALWSTTSMVNVSWGFGDGSFTRAQELFDEQMIQAVLEHGDMNADGVTDVIIASLSPDSGLVWLPGLGSRSFGPARTIPLDVIGQPTGMQIIELGGNTLPDLFLSGASGCGYVLDLSGPALSTFTLIQGAPGGATMSDIDLDGDLDIVGRNFGGSSAIYFDQVAPLVFQQVPDVFNTAFGTVLAIVQDMDQDGDQDVVAVRNENVAIFLNDTSSGFTPPVYYPHAFSTFNGLTTGDINNDGYPDVIGTGVWPTIAQLLNNGSGGFLTSQTLLQNVATQENAIQVADVDGDGTMDLVHNSLNGPIYWSRGLGGGALDRLRQVVPILHGRAPSVGDLDMDGDLDILLGRVWIEQEPAQVFNRVHDAVVQDWWGIAAGDINGDGLVDLFNSSSPGSGTPFGYALNNGTGFDAPTILFTLNGTATNVESWDPDADGNTDLLVVGFSGTTVLRNTGQGQFTSTTLGNGNLSMLYSIPADVTGDGAGDLVVMGNGNSFTASLSVLAYSASWSFPSIATIGPFQPPVRRVRAADAELDGDIDLLLEHDGILKWALNNGNGTSWTVQSTGIAVLISDFAYAPGDLDGDGLKDVAWIDPAGNALSWARNLGNGTHGPAQLIHQRPDLSGVKLADMDGDGDDDILLIESARTWLIVNDHEVTTSTGAEERHSPMILAYPQPIIAGETLTLVGPWTRSATIELLDACGALVRSVAVQGMDRVQLPTLGLPAGMYVVRASDGRVAPSKVLVMN
jgi:hypothetical protein